MIYGQPDICLYGCTRLYRIFAFLLLRILNIVLKILIYRPTSLGPGACQDSLIVLTIYVTVFPRSDSMTANYHCPHCGRIMPACISSRRYDLLVHCPDCKQAIFYTVYPDPGGQIVVYAVNNMGIIERKRAVYR